MTTRHQQGHHVLAKLAKSGRWGGGPNRRGRGGLVHFGQQLDAVFGNVNSWFGAEAPGAAERFYARLNAKEPQAWAGLRTIIARAKAGDPAATNAWLRICRVHDRSKARDWTSATSSERQAAGRLYMRLSRGEGAAWDALDQLAQAVQAGNDKAVRAWTLLTLAHAQMAHTQLSGADAIAVPDAVVTYLLSSISRARYAPPPSWDLSTRNVIPFALDQSPDAAVIPTGSNPRGTIFAASMQKMSTATRLASNAIQVPIAKAPATRAAQSLRIRV